VLTTFLFLAVLIAVVSLAAGEMVLHARRRRRREHPIDLEAWARQRRATRPDAVEEKWK
jgi:hypothetical protein